MSSEDDSVPTVATSNSESSNLLSKTDATPPLSKNARKRLIKAEHYAAVKAERRARDKEKKRERAEKRRAGDPDALEDAEQRRAKRHKLESARVGPKNLFEARVVIDLAFDDLMSEKEVVSLCSQLAYTYSSNRKSRTPFKSLLCTSLNGQTLARLNALGDQHKRWQHVEFWEESYSRLWEKQEGEVDIKQGCTQESVVYLTGDAEEELEELREGETYIIGGICDHNRYKNLCLNKAKEQSIRSARLPIGKYLKDLPTRKILTVNQVFDILIHWVEGRDWEKALYIVMPKRKFQQGGTQDGDGSSTMDGQGDEIEGAGIEADGGAGIDGNVNADEEANSSESADAKVKE